MTSIQLWFLQEECKLENVIVRSALVGNAAASASCTNVAVRVQVPWKHLIEVTVLKKDKRRNEIVQNENQNAMIVREPMLEKRLRKCQDGSGIDDESEFAPTCSVIATDLSFESAIHNTSNVTNVNGSGNKESTDKFWGNINIPFDTVIEL